MIPYNELSIFGWIFYVLVAIIILTVYCNIGYWGGKSAADARIENENLNAFQKFQVATNKIGSNHIFYHTIRTDFSLIVAMSVILWPVWFVCSLLVWFVKIMFLGGLFRFIGKKIL